MDIYAETGPTIDTRRTVRRRERAWWPTVKTATRTDGSARVSDNKRRTERAARRRRHGRVNSYGGSGTQIADWGVRTGGERPCDMERLSEPMTATTANEVYRGDGHRHGRRSNEPAGCEVERRLCRVLESRTSNSRYR